MSLLCLSCSKYVRLRGKCEAGLPVPTAGCAAFEPCPIQSFSDTLSQVKKLLIGGNHDDLDRHRGTVVVPLVHP